VVALTAWPPPPALEELLDGEMAVLACLTAGRGGLAVAHPYPAAVALAAVAVDGWAAAEPDAGPPSPGARALAAAAWGALNDAYLFTDVALVAGPAALALAALVLAATQATLASRAAGLPPPHPPLSPHFLASLPLPGLVMGGVAAAAADMAAGYEAAADLAPDGGADAAGRAVAVVAAAERKKRQTAAGERE